MKTVFDRIDSQKWNLFGFSPFAIIQNVSAWRKYFLVCAILSLILWSIFGFDSTWEMGAPFVQNIIPLMTGRISFSDVVAESQSFYGLGNHWSAPVIYGFAFILLSLHLERVGIKKSLNFYATSSLSLMSIGIFEWAYNILYATCQNQPWTTQFRWKQITNLSFFTLFIVIGFLTFLYLYPNYHPNFNKVTVFLFGASTVMWLLWIFYPFPIGHIDVQTTSGIWRNTSLFPQTMYAVDMNPLDNIAIGVPYHVGNDLLHATNTLTKVTSTGAILSLCWVKPLKKVEI